MTQDDLPKVPDIIWAWIEPVDDNRGGYHKFWISNPDMVDESDVKCIRADSKEITDLIEDKDTLKNALADLLGRHVLYCGGHDFPFAGHTDLALYKKCKKVLDEIN